MNFGGLSGLCGGEGAGKEKGAILGAFPYVHHMSQSDQTLGTLSWGEGEVS
jgi:hypothetical protein